MGCSGSANTFAGEQKLASAPKRRKKRRTDTFDQVLGPAIDSSQAVDETETFDEVADALEEAHSVEDADTADRAPP